MNCKIPFTKDIHFEKKVSEITSISLEHTIEVDNEVLMGNFIVARDFKSHEVSINKEAFSYILPFEIELKENINKDTIEFMIEDFTYDIIDSSILRVNIDFNIIASLNEENNQNETAERTDNNIFPEANALESEEIPEVLETKTDPSIEDLESIDRQNIIDSNNYIDNPNDEVSISEESIINNINNNDDEYATYHIHMVKNGETIETICTMYNSNMNILSEYNDLNSLSTGDKLIIPDNNE